MLRGLYTEWMGVRDFSSHGETSRIRSPRTGLEHTVLSKTEKAVFLAVEQTDNVRVIQCQRRLERSLTQAAATVLGAEHPLFPGTRVPYVMSVDALVQAKRFQHARWSPELEPAASVPDDLTSALRAAKGDSKMAMDLLESWGVAIRCYEKLVRTNTTFQWTVYDSKL
ncbi:hypothetical protein ACQUZK_09135, partial [Streptococcus pyogenes]|uniref:hypothetical protein n=1 Tax=Streptococcus pyogenes TaxID=1314 RepID=UPI003DA14B93